MSTSAHRTVLKVLLVEDHPLIAVGLRVLLTSVPDIELAGWVKSLALVNLAAIAVDAVVLDLRLQDSSIAAVNVSKIVRHGIPVVIYSEADDEAVLRAAVRAGASGLVTKSQDPEALAEAIRAAARGDISEGMAVDLEVDSEARLADPRLTEREQQVLGLYAAGRTAQEVASALSISVHSVAAYLRRIRKKYALVDRSAVTRVDLFQRATEDGLMNSASA